jgi:hypothetical protein
MALTSPAAFALWPNVSGRLGSYNVQTEQEVADMAGDGLTAVIINDEDIPGMDAAMESAGVRTVDTYPWVLIADYGCSDYFYGQATTCQISDSTSAWILSQLQAHLAAQQGNSNVIAYWILDDYPGADLSSLLQKMHDLIVASNHDPSASFSRPAICGVGGSIAPLSDTHITDADPIMHGFKQALINFRPSYCDIVALYLYAGNMGYGYPKDPSQYDWSMTYLLPAILKDLEGAGWSSSTEPLVALPQAFGYDDWITPTGADLATQMTAYCKAGAVALFAYSWEDDYPVYNPNNPYLELFNSEDLRTGLQSGFTQCRTYWPQTSG